MNRDVSVHARAVDRTRIAYRQAHHGSDVASAPQNRELLLSGDRPLVRIPRLSPAISTPVPSSVTQSRTSGFVAVEKDGVIQTKSGVTLKVGPVEDFCPELVISKETVENVARSLAGPDTLFVADRYNYPRLQSLGPTVLITDGAPETVRDICQRPDFSSYRNIVGVGGCLSLDLARAVAVDGQNLTLVPTLLSTNCITKNRAVLGKGLDEFSYRTATPHQVIIPVREIASQPSDLKSYWSMAGFGDFFSKLSAMTEQLDAQGKAATIGNLRAIDPEVVDGLDWVNRSFTDYNETTLTKLAVYAHNAGVKILGSPNNDISVGGEHKFYKGLLEMYPQVRERPPHGTVVAIGTLLTARAYAETIGSTELYDQIRSAFTKLGLPTTYEGLAQLGLTREMISKGLERIAQPDVKASYMGDFFRAHGDSFLDRIFNPSPVRPSGSDWEMVIQ